MLKKIHHQLARSEQSAGVVYSDVQIVAMSLWAVIHDRNQKWACQPINWPRLPVDWPGLLSASQFSRRLRSPKVQALLNRLEADIRSRWPEEWCLIVDGKPLPVGGFSKDPDATTGYGAGQFYRGYKLHAIWGNGPIPWAWDVLPANVSEPTTATKIVASVPGEGYLLGDAAYDSNPLHNASAAVGRKLVAPRKKPGTGLGRGTKHHPQRLQSIELTENTDLHPFAVALHNWRTGIERQFGWLTSGVASLQNLPTFVRRLPRVRRWIQAKLIINALAP
jgi:hypothetical protein